MQIKLQSALYKALAKQMREMCSFSYQNNPIHHSLIQDTLDIFSHRSAMHFFAKEEATLMCVAIWPETFLPLKCPYSATHQKARTRSAHWYAYQKHIDLHMPEANSAFAR